MSGGSVTLRVRGVVAVAIISLRDVVAKFRANRGKCRKNL